MYCGCVVLTVVARLFSTSCPQQFWLIHEYVCPYKPFLFALDSHSNAFYWYIACISSIVIPFFFEFRLLLHVFITKACYFVTPNQTNMFHQVLSCENIFFSLFCGIFTSFRIFMLTGPLIYSARYVRFLLTFLGLWLRHPQILLLVLLLSFKDFYFPLISSYQIWRKWIFALSTM